LLWVDLGKARERAGDSDGAERALRQAIALAPYYATPKWALGNTLIRTGLVDEGFGELREASAAYAGLAGPTAAAAVQMFGDDMEAIRRIAGADRQITSELIDLLVRDKRSSAAFDLWSTLAKDQRTSLKTESIKGLASQLAGEKQFGRAFDVYRNELPGGDIQPQVVNGDFEGDIKAQSASVFEWQLGPGDQPQIALTDGQHHGGARALWLIFNSTEAKDFRSVSQTVAVKGGVSYTLSVYYRSELKTSAALKWEVVDAVSGQRLAITDAIAPVSDWARLTANFATSPSSEGVVIRLVRENCNSAICPVAGRLWFDDISIESSGAHQQ
jgi:hypothetical protein